MRNKQPLKQILAGTRDYWDRPQTRPAVRQNFESVVNCRTPALGAEVYGLGKRGETCLPHLQIESLSELWASSHPTLATRAMGLSPGHPVFRHRAYYAGCPLADLSTEPPFAP
jgi:hypothetical protein